MKKSELVKDLCKTSDEGAVDREESSEVSNGWREMAFVPLYQSDKDKKGIVEFIRKLKIIIFISKELARSVKWSIEPFFVI